MSELAQELPRTRVPDLVALTKPRILIMVLATAAGGYWLSAGKWNFREVAATLVGLSLVVGGANALNMYIERESDARMERTRNRPLPAGRMHPRAALWFGLLLGALGLPLLFWMVNPLTGVLVGISLFLYVLAYTPLKQHSSFALLVGAIPGAIPPLVGWTAAANRLSLPGLVLFAILFIWQVPHFLAISLFRKEEYARAGIHLLALESSDRIAKHQIVFYLLALIPVTFLPFLLHVAGPLYLFAAALLGLLFLGWGLWGLRESAGPRWARQLFIISLVYLTFLFAALVVDRMLLT